MSLQKMPETPTIFSWKLENMLQKMEHELFDVKAVHTEYIIVN